MMQALANPHLKLYSLFHLNLAYSSIEEDQHQDVIRRCYWPLLRLARELDLPFGIEAPGYTLERIAALDPEWIIELRLLTTDGPCEFIGSGYAQLIGPLVPAEVNLKNLTIGHQVYEKLLGFQPDIALVNEQAYSAGLIQNYLNASYRAIIMEWNNSAGFHPEWNAGWRYLPQYACDCEGERIPLIWSNSIAFQKIQHHVHGEIDLDEYMEYLCQHLSENPRCLALYSNDVEIFDFRPGRYETEALMKDGEWQCLGRLFQRIQADGRFNFIRPRDVLEHFDVPGGGNALHLESAEQPIPVKKQGKYNIVRWAATGRDDLYINTKCWQIFKVLNGNPGTTDDEWKELCYLWSSDFRTHITEKRWTAYLDRLAGFAQKMRAGASSEFVSFSRAAGNPFSLADDAVGIERIGKFITVSTPSVRLKLNCQRGMAIDRLWLGNFDCPFLCGTLPHAYYDDIILGADWYTGHVIFQAPGQRKVTDLNPVEPSCTAAKNGDIIVEGTIHTNLGIVNKVIRASVTLPEVTLEYSFRWENLPAGSFRVGNITLNPQSFDWSTLCYRTHNGGRSVETFPLAGRTVEHGEAVSPLISAKHALGVTEGWVEIKDSAHILRIETDRTVSALVGLMSYREVGNTYFCRLAFSAGEVDETRKPGAPNTDGIRCRIRLSSR